MDECWIILNLEVVELLTSIDNPIFVSLFITLLIISILFISYKLFLVEYTGFISQNKKLGVENNVLLKEQNTLREKYETEIGKNNKYQFYYGKEYHNLIDRTTAIINLLYKY